jgi:hypothetical protein
MVRSLGSLVGLGSNESDGSKIMRGLGKFSSWGGDLSLWLMTKGLLWRR